MCGIAVAIDWEGAEHAVARLIEGILHRGDVTDPIVSPRPNTAMCTRRLRIVDAENAVQPQISSDGRLCVSFNGEIYNYVALRAELEGLGIEFDTESDTEVLANALQVWGAKALERISGMYAFVAIDTESGEFLAARDPFGVKPLYVIQSETGFLFCSEIRPLLKAAEKGDVLLLPPGYLLTRKFCARYRTLANPSYELLSQGSPRELDRLLSEAVRLRLPTDLPFATMLSGGIDSTLIAHYARQYRPEAPGYFLGDKTAPDYIYAARFAEQNGIDLRIVPFGADKPDTFSLIEQVVDTVETFEPSVIANGVCTYVLARKISQDGFRVALCGEGADELFAGYATLETVFAQGNAIGRPVREECLGLMNRTNLQRVDRCTMRFGIETREPFLDRSVVEYALNLDATALVREDGGRLMGKMPLRAIYDLHSDRLPAMIRDRKKIPFDEGTGLDTGRADSAWAAYFDRAISHSDLQDGMREFSPFDIHTKEELYYLRHLSQTMDISRVPHLCGRTRVMLPTTEHPAERGKKAAA
ncbi:MAG: asparagine synthetase B [Rhizomicrobium sp.]|jgi:asparagine synthase (glutamine-hydrolysing)